MKKIIAVIALIVFPAVTAFAEPAWETTKAAIKKDIPNRLNGKINLIKIEDAKDGERWLNRDVYPAAVMFTHSGWVYFSTDEDLPGETFKQRICANYEKIDGKWVFKNTGIPVDNSFEQVTPPKKLPPLPDAPDTSLAKDAYIECVKKYFKDVCSPGLEAQKITIEKFDIKGKPVYKKDPNGYMTVTYVCPVTVKYTAIAKEIGGRKLYNATGEGPAEVIFSATKKPAKLWYESNKVDKWDITVTEDYTEFHKDREELGSESSNDSVGEKAGSAASKLKKLFD